MGYFPAHFWGHMATVELSRRVVIGKMSTGWGFPFRHDGLPPVIIHFSDFPWNKPSSELGVSHIYESPTCPKRWYPDQSPGHASWLTPFWAPGCLAILAWHFGPSISWIIVPGLKHQFFGLRDPPHAVVSRHHGLIALCHYRIMILLQIGRYSQV